MDGDRAWSLLADPDQWTRCSHAQTALLDGGGVTLAWQSDADGGPAILAGPCAGPSTASSAGPCDPTTGPPGWPSTGGAAPTGPDRAVAWSRCSAPAASASTRSRASPGQGRCATPAGWPWTGSRPCT